MYIRLCPKKAEAYAAYDIITEKAKISTGKKIDAIMGKARVALFYLDAPQVCPCTAVVQCRQVKYCL